MQDGSAGRIGGYECVDSQRRTNRWLVSTARACELLGAFPAQQEICAVSEPLCILRAVDCHANVVLYEQSLCHPKHVGP